MIEINKDKIYFGKFIKKNGEEREMLFTVNPDLLPAEKIPTCAGRTLPDGMMAVFDLDKQDWRTFNFNTMTELTEVA